MSAVTAEEKNALLDGIASHAAIIDRCTLHPWVVAVSYHTEPGCNHLNICVVERTMSDPPDPLGYLPLNGNLNRHEVFPAARFDDMPASTRNKWTPHYRTYLLWRKAKALGKEPGDMQPWADYDAVLIDESVQRWASPGVRYTGD